MRPDSETLYGGATQAMGNGYPVCLAAYGTKAHAFRNPRPLTPPEVRFHMNRRPYNVATLLGREVLPGRYLAALDADTERAKEYIRDRRLGSPACVLTARGEHHHVLTTATDVRNKIDHLGIGLDVLFHGMALLPPSRVGEWEYRWLRQAAVGELPVIDPGMFREPKGERPSVPVVSREVESVRRYVGKIVARCHSRAHGQAYRCACKIADRVGDFETAMRLFREWNATNAVAADGVTPYPFSESELHHKMTDAFRRRG